MTTSPPSPVQNPSDIYTNPQERLHFYSVLDSFGQYRKHMHHTVTHVRRQRFYALPQSHWTLLAQPPISYLDTLERVDDAIDTNSKLVEAIYKHSIAGIGATFVAADPTNVGQTGTLEGHPRGEERRVANVSNARNEEQSPWEGSATPLDLQKANSTVNQLFRDWSAAGAIERQTSYMPVHRSLLNHCPPATRVLVPGAGLGRLVIELAARGYHAEGNEVSYHQLLVSNWILNCSSHKDQWTIYPFLTGFSNRYSRDEQLRAVTVPDILPQVLIGGHLDHHEGIEDLHGAKSESSSPGSMGMSMGDFVDVYSRAEHASTFDAVASVFFLDTAPDIVEYVKVVKSVLKPGGVWINVGPLLWHFDSSPPEQSHREDQASANTHNRGSEQDHKGKIGSKGSVELSNEEVLMLLGQFGFEIVEHEELDSTSYIGDEHSMLTHSYRPVHWVARKFLS